MIQIIRPNNVQQELPECLTLWFCIGCGAMGNTELCLASCDFRKLVIVSAAIYADLLEMTEHLDDEVERLGKLVRQIASLTPDESGWETTYYRLQRRAREALRTCDANLMTPLDDSDAAIERMIVWRCATCGQVEAPQACLGICIRHNGDFVRDEDHDRVLQQGAVARQQVRDLGALLRQLAWVRPHDGQWERSCRAFHAQAVKLIGGHPASDLSAQRF